MRFEYSGLKKKYFLLMMAGTVLYMIATFNGNHYTADGRAYKKIASNIHSGTGYFWGKGEVWVWPPLYPYLLSAGYFSGHVDIYIRLLHLAFLMITYLIWIKFSDKELTDYRYRIITVLMIIFNTSVLYCHVFVLSEAAFIMISGFYLYFISQWLEGRHLRDLILATIAGFMALMTRNAGIFFIAGAFIYVLMYSLIKRENREALLFSIHMVMVISGFALWNVSKLWLGGHMDFVTGMVPFLDIGRNWTLISKNIASAFIPFALPRLAHTLFTVALFIFLGYVFIRYKTDKSIQMLMSVILFYLLFWLVVPADQWEVERFLAPLFPPLLLILFYSLEKVGPGVRIPSWVFVLILLYPALRIVKNALFWGGFLKIFNFENILSYL